MNPVRLGGFGPECDKKQAVSRRALIVAFALVPANTFLLTKSVYLSGNSTVGPIFYNIISGLLGLAVLNRALKRWRPDWQLRPGEMLTVYVVLWMSSALVGGAFNVGGSLPAIMTYPFWFATPENGWQELIWPYLPSWLTVQDPSILAGFWEGDANPYSWGVIKGWAAPAFWWMIFVAAVMWVCLCLNSIMRRRWSDEEKLPFPFVAVPLQLAEGRFELFRSKVWWVGLGLSFGVTVWNAAAHLVPNLPAVPLDMSLGRLLANRWPWEGLTHRVDTLTWPPYYFGVCYLMPLDMLFSLWVFGALTLAAYVLIYCYGWVTAGGFPYMDHQSTGALLGLALAFIWLDRRYFSQILRRAFVLRSASADEGREAFSYRTALLGALLGIGFLWWFWARAGVPSWVLLLFLTLYFALQMMISRIRAQVGSPTHELYLNMPDTMLKAALGPVLLGPRALGMLALLSYCICADQDNSASPVQLETLKLAEGARMEPRRIATAVALVAPVTMLCYFWAYVHFGYDLGTGTAKTHTWQHLVARIVTEDLDSSLRHPAATDPGPTKAMGFGFIITLLLLFLRLRFQWWPLHPIAYPISESWWMHSLFPPLLLTWLVKLLLTRYGGLRAHRAALPFFLGLLVGDCSAALLRVAIFLPMNLPP